MKKVYLMLVFFCVMALAGCRKDDFGYGRPSSIQILSAEITFSAAGTVGRENPAEVRFKVTGGGKVEVKQANVDWITDVTLNGNRLTYRIAENYEPMTRSAWIMLANNEDKVRIDIVQTGAFFGINENDRRIILDPLGQTYNVTVTSSGVAPEIVENADWLEVAVAGSRLTLTCQPNFSGAGRSATVKLVSKWIENGRETEFTTELTVNQGRPEIITESYSYDKAAHTSAKIVLPEYFVRLCPGLDVRSTDPWLEVTFNETESSFTFNVSENGTGAGRTGHVNVISGDGSVVQAVPVKQMGYGYADVLGLYSVQYRDGDNVERQKPMRFEQDEENVSYKVTYNEGDLPYIIKMGYESTGVITMLAQQKVLEDFLYTWSGSIFTGKTFNFYLRPAPDDIAYYVLTPDTGFDLTYSGNGTSMAFDFIPNKILQEYAPDAYSFALPSYYVETGAVGFVWEILKPSGNLDYIRIEKQ